MRTAVIPQQRILLGAHSAPYDHNTRNRLPTGSNPGNAPANTCKGNGCLRGYSPQGAPCAPP
ncbi:hypothetical protein SAMN05216601_101354 [Ectopseudomonas composti]|uniref:Uncharacterized protein n=1 Tax=Ectopseudomonas composti TaxID=658457 RepID=A0A1I5JFT7_9GAMM|nr:hypothetical protein SAMN05216601_101354 [Pseudomonas composti]